MGSSGEAEKRTLWLKQRSAELGFSFCGVARAERLDEEAGFLEKWLHEGKHGRMQYMENHFDKRVDPSLLVPGAKTVVSLLFNYFPSESQPDDAPKISRYAWGEDYHYVLKQKLRTLVADLELQLGAVNGRVFVDSAPVLERAWAVKAGNGWIGKNGNLIRPGAGSWFFLAEIISDVELIADDPMKDYCGTCTACLDACPTDALSVPYEVDGSRCISYFTIELKEAVLPSEMKGKFEDWVFGCDICQEVCPWNRFSTPHAEPSFEPIPGLMQMDRKQWMEITSSVFKKMFRHSALKRTGYKGLRRNLDFLQASNPDGTDE